MTRTRTAAVRNVSTARMRPEELARVWAAQHGIEGRVGGWLYTSAGEPVCHGWQSLATSLVRQGIVVEGVGVDWRRTDLVGLARVVRTVVGHRSGL